MVRSFYFVCIKNEITTKHMKNRIGGINWMKRMKINIITMFIAAAVISLTGTAEAAEKQRDLPLMFH